MYFSAAAPIRVITPAYIGVDLVHTALIGRHNIIWSLRIVPEDSLPVSGILERSSKIAPIAL